MQALVLLRRAVADLVDLTAPTPELVRAAVHGAVAIRSTHAAERHAIQEVVNNLRAADGAPRLTFHHYEELHAAQEEIFRRGQEQGHVRASLDPRVLAVTYQGAVDAMLAHLDVHPDADAARWADGVVDVLVSGFRSSEQPGV